MLPMSVLPVSTKSSENMSGEEKEKTSSEEKTGNPVDTEKVHSANSWESVDLGDDDRKKKFLKLMGASKKEHHGRFVIGDQPPVQAHTRAKTETEVVNQKLEDQYKQSLDLKINRWHHKGLGFSDEERRAAAEEGVKSTSSEADGADNKDNQSGDSQDDKGDNSEKTKDSETEKVERKRESTDTSEIDNTVKKKPKMMMGFVKASDS